MFDGDGEKGKTSGFFRKVLDCALLCVCSFSAALSRIRLVVVFYQFPRKLTDSVDHFPVFRGHFGTNSTAEKPAKAFLSRPEAPEAVPNNLRALTIPISEAGSVEYLGKLTYARRVTPG